MSEFVRYSRLILWIGALILLLEAVSGRSGGLVTVVGTLLLAGGFAAFLAGLALEAPASQVPVDQVREPVPQDNMPA